MHVVSATCMIFFENMSSSNVSNPKNKIGATLAFLGLIWKTVLIIFYLKN